jgi:hypothetical protein
MDRVSHGAIRSWAEEDMASTLSIFDLKRFPSSHLAHYLALAILPLLIFFLCRKVVEDYRAYIALGPGGTPSTPRGYVKICFLRLFARWDVFTPPKSPIDSISFGNYFAGLKSLPQRQGPRPKITGIAPQRQKTQIGSKADIEALHDAMRGLVDVNRGLISSGVSCFEHHNLGLFLETAGNKTLKKPSPDTPERHCNPTCGTPPEIAHAHKIDGSLHLTLHPADVKAVIERGWGQRHPLAGRGPWVPSGFVIVYAPRNPEERKTVMEIIRAGCWWVSGIELAECVDLAL